MVSGTIIGRQANGPPTGPVLQLRDLGHAATHEIGAAAMMEGELTVTNLGYEFAPSPTGFATWDEYYRDLGLPEAASTGGVDRISDPQGGGPDIWFQVVQDAKAVKNRLHIDIHASGDRTDPIQTRKRRVDTEADRLVGLGATITWRHVPGRNRPLCGRDEGPRRERVRHQLTCGEVTERGGEMLNCSRRSELRFSVELPGSSSSEERVGRMLLDAPGSPLRAGPRGLIGGSPSCMAVDELSV
ncbi:VOC family protein [Nocardia sp. CS682]|uniref:VOC family protein n=1 Tax=Nocardia sp. CS682 TaxID=1047172 RepID=UPI00197F3F34|nr:VOC family protein [Nocardia sp. CS682]